MELGQNAPFAGFGKVQVDLGGRNGTVAEKFLDVFDVGPFFQHQSGEGMTKGVGCDVFVDARAVDIFADQVTDGLSGQGRAELADEHKGRGLLEFHSQGQVAFKRRHDFHAAEVKKPLFVAFADDPEGLIQGVEIRIF